jgi:CheY-like chemotaxis protein
MIAEEQVQVLLVEDDEVDVMAVKRAFRKLAIENPLTVACDGIEALKILQGSQNKVSLCRPFLVILDWNMPRMNGAEFLQALRSDSNLKNIVVFVMTTSNDERDRIAAYDQNVAGYIVKSNNENEFTEIIAMLQNFWSRVQLP